MNEEKGNKRNIRLLITPSRKGGRKTTPPPFWGNILTTLLIFLTLLSLYSFLTESFQRSEEIPLSQLASDIEKGEVKTIIIEGEKLTVGFVNGEEKVSKKEE